MAIELVRIDDRLIHGQVVTQRCSVYKIEQIIVVDNRAASDPVERSVLQFASPNNVRVLIFSKEKFLEIIKKTPVKKRTALIFSNPSDILYLSENGVAFNEINIGGMQFKKGKKRLSEALSIEKKDHEAFMKLAEKNIKLSVRMIPKENELLYENLIGKEDLCF